LYCGKFDPSLYLRVEVRTGISSFTLKTNRKEVAAGLKALRAGMASGMILEVMDSYKNDLGDYLGSSKLCGELT
jgi:hypothetical protein